MFFPDVDLEPLKAAQVSSGCSRREISGGRVGEVECAPRSVQYTLLFPRCRPAYLPSRISDHNIHLWCVQAMYPVFCQELVSTAYCVAARAHRGQQRKDGAPLIQHCLNVAKVLAAMGLDTETVAAGLLHESLGSSNSSIYQSQLEEFMPSSVVGLVERVNTITEMSRIYRQASCALSLPGYALAGVEVFFAAGAKDADRALESRRSLLTLPPPLPPPLLCALVPCRIAMTLATSAFGACWWRWRT